MECIANVKVFNTINQLDNTTYQKEKEKKQLDNTLATTFSVTIIKVNDFQCYDNPWLVNSVKNLYIQGMQ